MHVQLGRRLRGGYRASSSRLPIKSPDPVTAGLQRPHRPEVAWTKEAERCPERAAGSRAWLGPVPPAPAPLGLGDAGRARSALAPRPAVALNASLSPCLPPQPLGAQSLRACRGHRGHPPEGGGAPRGLVQSRLLPTLNLHPTVPGAGLTELGLWRLEKR